MILTTWLSSCLLKTVFYRKITIILLILTCRRHWFHDHVKSVWLMPVSLQDL
nr:MAG TPA: hypothetical protein [Caudoviricetes sp.]